ncbi:MAG: ATP-binding cassette domain-containing protein [Firmicutes bacterium]|jgi:peptide/nickel transport system ATP-binding protein|nr:ATP-binding cassette domain-containing protein [Bacillota bacterium]
MAVPATESAADAILRVEDLKKYYKVGRGMFRKRFPMLHSVDGISFDVRRGEVLGLVGESGCGKTTAGRMIVRLTEPTGGRILLDGADVSDLSHAESRRFRQKVQMVFQDPYESLDPRMTIFDIVAEPLNVACIGSLDEREERVAQMLNLVGITPPATFLFRFPHELSGGQRQRVAIARALVVNPSFVVADEPTSMLDVSIRTGVMKLMAKLREDLGISYLYITHDLAVARYLCHRIAVMYLGKIVEMGPAERIIKHPVHPYTKALISAAPVPDPAVRRPVPNIRGGVGRPIDPFPRCRFYDRCPTAAKACGESDHPKLEELEPGHYVACHITPIIGGR